MELAAQSDSGHRMGQYDSHALLPLHQQHRRGRKNLLQEANGLEDVKQQWVPSDYL